MPKFLDWQTPSWTTRLRGVTLPLLNRETDLVNVCFVELAELSRTRLQPLTLDLFYSLPCRSQSPPLETEISHSRHSSQPLIPRVRRLSSAAIMLNSKVVSALTWAVFVCGVFATHRLSAAEDAPARAGYPPPVQPASAES